MKNIKKISFLIMILIITCVFIFDNKLDSYATNYIYDKVLEDAIFKTGDTIELTKEYLDSITMPWYDGSLSAYCINEEDNYRNSGNCITVENDNGTIIGTITDNTYNYWRLKKTDVAYAYGYVYVELEGFNYEYEKPTISLTCDKEKIESNEETTCAIKIIYKTLPQNISFNIDTPNGKVSNITPGPGWKIEDNIYNPKEDEEEQSSTLATFTYTSNNYGKQNIILNNLTYIDDYTPVGTLENTTATITVKEKTTKIIKKLTDNPPTGTKEWITLSIVFIIFLIGIFILHKQIKKNKFKKI